MCALFGNNLALAILFRGFYGLLSPRLLFFFCLWKGNHLENALTLSNFIDGFRRWMHATDRWAQAGLAWHGRKVVKLPI